MSTLRTLSYAALSVLGLLLGGSPALAAQASFSVGAQVVASATADRELLASVPVPSSATLLISARGQRHHAFAGGMAEAGDYFRTALPAQGWHLIQLGGDADRWQEQVWESARGRVVVRLQSALGSVAATRISLTAGAARQPI